jgi:hypothetical protein
VARTNASKMGEVLLGKNKFFKAALARVDFIFKF